MVRRAKDWLVANKNLSDEVPMAGANLNVNRVVEKLATFDVRAMSLLRFRIPNLLIPLSCVIDYYGIFFEVQSPIPLTQTSLIYGSDTNGLLFKNDDPDGVKMAR